VATATRIPELLAPAGSWQALVAAVGAGADAVYLGAKRFGARMLADNFETKELKEALNYAHERNVRAYVTVNTLIHDSELEEVAGYLVDLYSAGADAVLVQDLGAAALSSRVVPDLPLHASTQMSIHNADGVRFAARMGMKRAVLARELSLADVQAIYRETRDLGIGLEAFIHGALCYCYSGQCLLSSAIGGRSGNRGLCAQPCRKPYVLMTGKADGLGRPLDLQATALPQSYLMSTRDLAAYPHLDQVARSPLQSLKIEGRMKSAQYVAVVTSVYRQGLDAIAEGRWSFDPSKMRDLALAFNRDFTDGYLMGSEDIMGREMSDKRGILIGTVAGYDPGSGLATIALRGHLRPVRGDGLVFLSPGEEVGMVVRSSPSGSKNQIRLHTPRRVRMGAAVRLTAAAALEEKAAKIAAQARTTPMEARVWWEDKMPVIDGSFPGPQGPVRVVYRSPVRMEAARQSPLTREAIAAQLGRTGGTAFRFSSLELDYPGGLFAPPAVLNQLRRDFLAAARSALLEAYCPSEQARQEAHVRLSQIEPAPSGRSAAHHMDLAVYVQSLEGAEAALAGGADRVYMEPLLGARGRYPLAQEILKEAEELARHPGQVVWKWPRITRDDFLKAASQALNRTGCKAVMVEGAGAALAADRAGAEVWGGPGLNVWNHQTVANLSSLRLLTLSPELSAADMAVLVPAAAARNPPILELLVQGNLEVMVTEDRLVELGPRAEFTGLQDFRRVFPIWADGEGRTHIQNSVETCLLDHLPAVSDLGVDSVSIDARHRPGRYIREMTEIYARARKAMEGGEAEKLAALKEEARDISLGGITTGHFLRGLKQVI